MTLHLPPNAQKLIDRLDFQASRLELQHTARAAWLKGQQAKIEARSLRQYIRQLIIKHHQN